MVCTFDWTGENFPIRPHGTWGKKNCQEFLGGGGYMYYKNGERQIDGNA
jgi:hypothetical protein